MKLGLVITNDWELFGDGSGDYFDVQHKPTFDLLKTIENHGAKLTLMAEIMQQLSHKELGKTQNWANEIGSAWEEILKETVRRGHDVQLHLHPQWIDGVHKDGRWSLNMGQSPMSAHSHGQIEKMIAGGKSYLERLLKPVKPEYKCIAFRAGGYCVEPSEILIKKLKETGFVCDTSVTKGLFSEGFYDFRDAHSNIIPWFSTERSVKYKGAKEQGILEMPIYSEQGIDSQGLRKFFPQIYYKLRFNSDVSGEELKWQKVREQVKNKRYPRENRYYKKIERKNTKWYLSAIVTKGTIQLDYDYLPPPVFVECLGNIFKNKKLKKYTDDDIIMPVVASGHIKDIHNCDNINRILDRIDAVFGDRIVFRTLSEAVEYRMEHGLSFDKTDYEESSR